MATTPNLTPAYLAGLDLELVRSHLVAYVAENGWDAQAREAVAAVVDRQCAVGDFIDLGETTCEVSADARRPVRMFTFAVVWESEGHGPDVEEVDVWAENATEAAAEAARYARADLLPGWDRIESLQAGGSGGLVQLYAV